MSDNKELRECDVIDAHLVFGRASAMAGVVQGEPIVCGGGGLFKESSYYSSCLRLGEKPAAPANLKQPRKFGASILVGKRLWLTGGLFSSKEQDISRMTEFLSYGKNDFNLPETGPDLPLKMSSHCLAFINETTIILCGGLYLDEQKKGLWRVKNSFFADIEKGMLMTMGPRLGTTRSGHVCGQLKLGQQKMAVFISGGAKGKSYIDSTEILLQQDNNAGSQWQQGPRMPLALHQAAGINSPDGAFLVVGGKRETRGQTKLSQSTGIFRLGCQNADIGSCQWTKLQQELVIGRSTHVAMLVPNLFATCK